MNRFLFFATSGFIAISTVRMTLFWFVGVYLENTQLVPAIGIALFLPSIFLTPLACWVIDTSNNNKSFVVVQALTVVCFLLVANVHLFTFKSLVLVLSAFIFSLASTYNKSYIYAKAKCDYENAENIILKLNFISTSMMVVSPAIVAIPLLFPFIPYVSLFYFSAFCSFVFVFFGGIERERSVTKINDYFYTAYKEVYSSSILRRSFLCFFLCNLAFGAIAVSFPLLLSNEFGYKTGGHLYSLVEVLGGVVSIIAIKYFFLLKERVSHLAIFASIALVFCFFSLNIFALIMMTITFFSYAIIQVVDSNVLFFNNASKDIVAGLRGVLTIGQSLAAAISCAIVYFLVYIGHNRFNLILSSIFVFLTIANVRLILMMTSSFCHKNRGVCDSGETSRKQ